MLGESYGNAPVSNLSLWGRKEDVAFEQPVGNDPRKQHHVRFWKSAEIDSDSQPAWMGSASYDKHVGLRYTTGQITHQIAADVDAERDHLFETLRASGGIASEQEVKNFHTIREGRNGGGDPWYTDGSLLIGTLGTADPNLHRAAVSVVGLIISVLWWFSSREAFFELVELVKTNNGIQRNRTRILNWLPIIFVVGWFGSSLVHAVLWSQPLGADLCRSD